MNTGQIVKSKTTERFTVIPNEILKSKDLTLGEKGLLAYLLSLPSDWIIYKKNLYDNLPDKPVQIDRYFKGLQTKGYIISVRVINEKSQFIGWNHVIYDIPAIEKPTLGKTDIGNSEKPILDFPRVGESAPILNTNLIQKTKESTKTEKTLSIKNLKEENNLIPGPNSVLLKSNLFREPIIPTLEDVELCFIQNGGTIEMAKAFYNSNESTGWFFKGSPIMNFRSLVGSYIRNWKNNEKGKFGSMETTEAAVTGQKIKDEANLQQLNEINGYFKKANG